MANKTPPKKNRKLQSLEYKSFRLQKRIKTNKAKLPSVRELWRQTIDILKNNKKFFAVFTLMYTVISFVVIQGGTTRVNLPQAKDLLGDSLGGTVPTSLALYAGLIGTSTQFSTQVGAFYQFALILIFSLAAIYALRHMYGKQARQMKVKESLYKGMTPLIPLLLVVAVLTLQILPISLGSSLYATVVSTGLAVTNIERIFWVILVILLGLLSLYLISGSIFGLFIVTLSDMTPMKALRASKELVRHRRMEVIRKIILLPIVLLVVMGLIVLPFIAFLPVLAQPIFLLESALVLPVVITYMYNLYRSLL